MSFIGATTLVRNSISRIVSKNTPNEFRALCARVCAHVCMWAARMLATATRASVLATHAGTGSVRSVKCTSDYTISNRNQDADAFPESNGDVEKQQKCIIEFYN